MLFRPDGAPVILDWTDAARGPAAVDFARLLVESMTSESRRAAQSPLAARYVAALAVGSVRDYDVERLLRDTSDAVIVLYAAALRWVAGPAALGPDLPRVPRVAESLLRRSADAVIAE